MYRILSAFLIISLINNTRCHEGFTYNPEVRISYKLHSVPQTWIDAKTICSEVGANLAMPMNRIEAAAILKIFTDYLAWEGLDDEFMFLDSHDYFSSNEFVTKNRHIEYFYHEWDADQPSNIINTNCLVMNTKGKLRDLSCNETFVYICQMEDSSYENSLENLNSRELFPTDPTYYYHNISSNKVKYFKLHSKKRTWPAARAICQAEGGRLAVIETSGQRTFLINMLNYEDALWPVPDFGNNSYIGFHDMYRLGTFYSVSDERMDSLSYVGWATGEPSYEMGDERCASLANEGVFNIRCNVPLQFFCERTFN